MVFLLAWKLGVVAVEGGGRGWVGGGRGGAEPPGDAEWVGEGGGREAGQKVEAAHQQRRVPQGGQRGGRRIVELERGAARPGDVDQRVVACADSVAARYTTVVPAASGRGKDGKKEECSCYC